MKPAREQGLNIAMLSNTTLFQSSGGLQNQIRETTKCLKALGLQVTYIDPAIQDFSEFDLVHLFGTMSGMYRVAEHLYKRGIPIVLSSLLQPHWTQTAPIAKRLDWLLQRLTHWHVKSEYHHAKTALTLSNALIALGERERKTICSAFDIPGNRVHIIPNGIPQRFFEADPTAAIAYDGKADGCILNVGNIGHHKNQRTLIDALAGTDLQVVLVGSAGIEFDASALSSIGNVRYWGPLDYEDVRLPSVYAASRVFCLPSLGEVMPLSVLEALAAGTPVVCTRHHGMDLSRLREFVVEVDPTDKGAIRKAIDHFLSNPPDRERCRQAVRHLTWEAVGKQILSVYRSVLAR